MVPVPTRPGDFTALDSAHQHHAVEVDLGAIAGFGFDQRPIAVDALLQADLQTNADANARGRLGSGRAGVHQGAYLKGVGRTPLAANWADEHDPSHSSGHLLASAAAREYLVSRYLEAAGFASTIVPCDGLLVAPLPAHTRSYVRAMTAARADRCPPPAIDEALHAISVKPAGFARCSNFLWALHHARWVAPSIADLWTRILGYLLPPGVAAPSTASSTPETLARAFADAVDRGIGYFGDYLRAGVYWGSFHNNFTADGRFLDLETPVVFGRPFVGIVCERGDDHDVETVDLSRGPYLLVGVEVFHYVRQMRGFLGEMQSLLARRAATAWRMGELERGFVGDLADALSALLGDSILFDRDRLEAIVSTAIGDALGADRHARHAIEQMVRAQYGYYFEAGAEPTPTAMRRFPLALAPSEPTYAVSAWYPAVLEDYLLDRLEAGRRFNEWLVQIDACTTVAEALAALRRAAADISLDRGV